MKCDNCGEDISGAVITRKDGTKWCTFCLKSFKKSQKTVNKVSTQDVHVKLFRKINDNRSYKDEIQAIADMYLIQGNKRVYTNGAVLLSDMDEVPESGVKAVNLDMLKTLGKTPDVKYVKIEKVLRNAKGGVRIIIPEDFYQYAQAFPEKERVTYRAHIQSHKIEVASVNGGDELDFKLEYEEFTEEIAEAFEVYIDLRYMRILQPREMTINGLNTGVIHSSYNPVVDAFNHVCVMPMAP